MTAPWEDFDAYNRPCSTRGCEHVFKIPTIHELVMGEMGCPQCEKTYDIDEDDVRMICAWLLARVERLERKDSPFAELDL